MWGGQAGVGRPSMPVGMVPLVPMTGAPVMPGRGAGMGPAEAAAAAARGQACAAWPSEGYQQPAEYQQSVYQPPGPHGHPPQQM